MPRVQTTRTVKIALIGLPIYLVVMLTLILCKFVGSCTAAGHEPALPAATNAVHEAATR